MSLRRVFLGLVLVVVLVSLGRSLRRSFASPSTRIEWRLEEMLAGFSKGRVRPVLKNVHADFMDDSSGATRDDVHGALLHLFLTEKDPETKAFRLWAELVPEELVIRVDETGERAEVSVHARFMDRRKGEELEWWDARAETDWVLEGGRWKMVRSRSVNHRERR